MMLICHHGENPHVINQQRTDMIVGVIADPKLHSIINCVKDKFKNVKQISNELKLSVSTTYHHIHELDRKNILILSCKIQFGKKIFLYKSKICKVVSTFEGQKIDVKIYTNLRD